MPSAVVDLDNVHCRFDDVHAVRGVSVRVHPGEHLCIQGVSGSGKSTLLNVIGLMDRPVEGSYHLLGEDVSDLDERRRAALRGTVFGFVFQQFHLIADRTVEDNVALGLLYAGVPRREWADRVARTVADVSMTHRTHAVCRTLSGGEQQRVAIARALVSHPSVVLCDEPTGNLDHLNTAAVLRVLSELHARGLTLITVTHDDEVARIGTRRAVMGDGALQAGAHR